MSLNQRYRKGLKPNGFYLTVIIAFLIGTSKVSSQSKDDVGKSGEIVLGGLFPIHIKSQASELECGERLRLPSYQVAHAMLYAVDQVNKNDNLLPNITIKAKIADTCRSQTLAASRTKEFIKLTLLPEADTQLAGIVGAAVSDVSAKVASILQVFQIPQISYGSTSVLLSDKDIYSYFLRTVPPDSFQAQAMVDLCLRFGWTYVITINSEGIYGSKGIEEFHKLAAQNDICTDHIATVKRLSNEENYEEIVEKMIERSEGTGVSAVVLFCTLGDSYGITRMAQKNKKASKFSWITSDAWGTTRQDLSNTSVLTIKMRASKVSEHFKNYFKALNVYDPKWKDDTNLRQFWREWFNCEPTNVSTSNLPKCTGKENLQNATFGFASIRLVVNTVYAFAHALDSLQKELCPNQIGMCQAMSAFDRKRLFEHLKNVSFQDSLNTTMKFNDNGEVGAMYDIQNFHETHFEKKYVRVGTWDEERRGGKLVMNMEDLKWRNGNRTVPLSYCSNHCPFGCIRTARASYNFSCCWICHLCDKLHIIINNTCVAGPVGYIPNANRTEWVKREVIYSKWSGQASAVLIVISSICIILTLFTLLVFCMLYNNRTVKASGRELCYIILTGILLCFITPFIYIAKPNDAICYARKTISGLALAMIYSALFMKINRVYRVFTSAMSTIRRPALVRPKSQILITIGLILIQVMLTILLCITKPPHSTETYYSNSEELILQCKIDPLLYVSTLGYVIVLMIMCTIYAFKTRKFPKNFNESKYIGVTLYITCIVSALFLAFLLNTKDSFQENTLIATANVVLGLITLLGLFGQRIYVIFLVKEARVDGNFQTAKQLSSLTNQSPIINVKNKKKDTGVNFADVKERTVVKKTRSISF